MAQEIDITVPVNDSRIAWVLDHPRMSDWLKAAVRTAQGRDPALTSTTISRSCRSCSGCDPKRRHLCGTGCDDIRPAKMLTRIIGPPDRRNNLVPDEQQQ